MVREVSFREAVAAIETAGAAFYRRLSSSVQDSNVRDVLAYLADQEEVHAKELGLLATDAEWQAELRDAFEKSHELLTLLLEELEELHRVAAELTRPEEALGLGLKLERNSILFYREILAEVRDPRAARLISQVIAQEKTHFRQLFLFRNLVKEGKTLDAAEMKRRLLESARLDELERGQSAR